MTIERAIEILKSADRLTWFGASETNEACKMGMEALKIINPCVGRDCDCIPTNAEVMIELLADIIRNGADEDGYPETDYNDVVSLTEKIKCPYINNSRCVHDKALDAYHDCDECKAYWLMKKAEG